MKQLHKVYIGVGSNLGDKYQNIYLAYRLIQSKIGNITSKSSIYISEPWGFESDELFLNSVIEIHSKLQPLELLNQLKQIEKELGRKKKQSDTYESRLIDLDILFYDKLILKNDQLTIPHPHVEKRSFVYMPLLEIQPNFIQTQTKSKLKNTVKIEKLKKFF